MCSICLQYPCDSRCPNTKQKQAVKVCYECQEEIYEGDEYYQLNGEDWCKSCVEGGYKIAELDQIETE